ncbi:MAG: class I SAM-dependent methyltransferase [Pedobacter sp.]|uniref:class I SAM-dependent methyltransferase n=1 Tax=Pedobacter sp. TaxID=1411316 RepID=UPI003564F8F5
MKSKITGGATELAFTAKVLNKYDVKYYRCLDTGFIQTEDPFWLKEAYSSAITKLDIGLISRNEELRNKTLKLIQTYFSQDKRFLDYAGGYGMFTRMMRDKGLDFYHHDIYCENLFAKYFELSDCIQQKDFEVITAFEVFEHLVNPIEEIGRIGDYGDSIFFTTVLQPMELESISDWWYISKETGQHIAFYTATALEHTAKRLGYHFWTDGISTHLFTKKLLNGNPFIDYKKEPYLIRTMKRKLSRFERKNNPCNRESLLQRDFDYIKSKL